MVSNLLGKLLMRNLLTIPALIFTVISSSASFAGWTKVAENVNGTYYVDFERIGKYADYIKFWELVDLFKPDKDGDLSYKLYQHGDCKLFRYKYLSASNYKQPMGGGHGADYNQPDKDWRYPSLYSVNEVVLKTVCDYVK